MKMGLQLNQQQKLMISNQVTASLKILQMPVQQLKEYIEQEAEDNIAIDIMEDYQSYSNQYGFTSNREEEASPLLFIAEKQSFKEYLRIQIIEEVKDRKMQRLCLYLIEGLDDKGFFMDDISSIAMAKAISEEYVHKGIEIIQGLEPLGVGTKNTKECLALQIYKKNPKDQSTLIALIDNHLEDIAANRYNKISDELKISLTKVHETIGFIKTLEPIPSRGFYTGEDIAYITPDAWIEKKDIGYEIILNERHLPKVFINPTYAKMFKDEVDTETREYLQAHIAKATSLIKDISNRGATLQRIIEAIIEYQKEYFNKNSSYPKPMTLGDIAHMVGFHESTISRAVQDKHICIENTIIKLRDLFAQGGTGDITAEEVKDKIRVMIEEEDKKKPLSDQYICEKVKELGIEISRRTVAKYRQEMGVDSSTQRKHR